MKLENNQNKSSHGGARTGAGRKAGSLTTKTRDIANKCAELGLTPLELMVDAMIKYHRAGDVENAVRVAKDAAPYIHPKLSTVELGSDADHPVKMVVSWKN